MLGIQFSPTSRGLALALLVASCATSSAATQESAVSEQEAYEVGIEAYVYLHPLITMDVTRRVLTNMPPGLQPAKGPANMFHHLRAFPPADLRAVVRPNFDTLYSSAWLDLTEEPMVVSAADTSGRYYMLPMLDMWTDVFAAPGKRTSGTQSQTYAIIPQGWQGTLPEGVDRIVAPTPYVWVIGRTQANGPADYETVNAIQDGFTVTPLSQWGAEITRAEFKPDPTVDMKTDPAVQVLTMPGSEYFSYGAELMKVNPPHLSDWSVLARLERIGIVAGKSFDFEAAPPAVRAGLERAAVDGLKLMRSSLSSLASSFNGWQMNVSSMGVYGNYYMKRAIVAMVGLGANSPEDAIYPLNLGDSAGDPVLGDRRYVLHFDAAELPPVNAFWSVTMYDSEGFQVPNALNRFALGDRDPLQYNEDGSLDLYFQHESPGAELESNWLPSPAEGVVGITMRLYWPKPQALDGRWNPPPIVRVE